MFGVNTWRLIAWMGQKSVPTTLNCIHLAEHCIHLAEHCIHLAEHCIHPVPAATAETPKFGQKNAHRQVGKRAGDGI